jgi:hypothetical protein
MASALLRLVRRARLANAEPSVFYVNADREEEEIAAAEAAGKLGPHTVIIRQFAFPDLDALDA